MRRSLKPERTRHVLPDLKSHWLQIRHCGLLRALVFLPGRPWLLV